VLPDAQFVYQPLSSSPLQATRVSLPPENAGRPGCVLSSHSWQALRRHQFLGANAGTGLWDTRLSGSEQHAAYIISTREFASRRRSALVLHLVALGKARDGT
jgi:hypothetical protein